MSRTKSNPELDSTG